MPPYKLIRSRRRSVALIIEPDASLTVRAPLGLPIPQIEQFIRQKTGWITQKQALVRARTETTRKFASGELLFYQGQPYRLQVLTAPKNSISLQNGVFRLATPSLPQASQVIQRWYQKQARSILPARLEELARRHGLRYSKIRISSARTRWGSCSARNVISLSWRLALAPQLIQDYVILHELAHTLEHNHSPAFWACLARLMPDYERPRQWLKKHGQYLHLDFLPPGPLPPL